MSFENKLIVPRLRRPTQMPPTRDFWRPPAGRIWAHPAITVWPERQAMPPPRPCAPPFMGGNTARDVPDPRRGLASGVVVARGERPGGDLGGAGLVEAPLSVRRSAAD